MTFGTKALNLNRENLLIHKQLSRLEDQLKAPRDREVQKQVIIIKEKVYNLTQRSIKITVQNKRENRNLLLQMTQEMEETIKVLAKRDAAESYHLSIIFRSF
jgi:hypothetical protein